MKMIKPIFLIACDQKYYEDWGYNLLRSLLFFNNPQNIILHCHIVNPHNVKKLPSVIYTDEIKFFKSDDEAVAYYQCARFLAMIKYYPDNEPVIAIDADSICTRSINQNEIDLLLSKLHVLNRNKKFNTNWLAGLIVFANKEFKEDFILELHSKPSSEWTYGWDQTVLNRLAEKYNFVNLPKSWMSMGQNGLKSVFLTLKGKSQKSKPKYTIIYNGILRTIRN